VPAPDLVYLFVHLVLFHPTTWTVPAALYLWVVLGPCL
jgi:hypothetical protein